MEKCQNHIDRFYTLRTKAPELFENKNFRLPHMQIAKETM